MPKAHPRPKSSLLSLLLTVSSQLEMSLDNLMEVSLFLKMEVIIMIIMRLNLVNANENDAK